jgi:hypothetical protein
VDTNTINQTLVLTITPTGRTPINKTVITIPAGYSFVNVSTVQYNGVNSTSDLSITTSPNYINITANTPSNATLNPIKVWFNVNTSVAYASGLFTPAIWGEGINGISGDVVSVNVTTQQLVNNVTITPTKMAAIVNGVDYWEFNFTLNITANATGLLQFKMSNWTDTSGNRMNISDGTTAYATLRNTSDFATTNKININSSYVDGVGITKVATQNELFTVILRMIIPSGTPISNSWMTTYGILFRAIPA